MQPEGNAGTTKELTVTGWVLIGTALSLPLVLSAGGWAGAADTGRLLGQLMASLGIGVVIAGLLVARSSPLAKARARLVVATLLLVYSATQTYAQYEAAQSVQAAASNLAIAVQDMQAHVDAGRVANPVAKPEIVKVETVAPQRVAGPSDRTAAYLDGMAPLVKQWGAVATRMEQRFSEFDFEKTLTPATLSSNDAVSAERQKIASFKSVIRDREVEVDKHFTRMRAYAASSNLSDSERRSALEGMAEGERNVRAMYRELGTAQLESISAVDRILAFIQQSQGRFTVQGGRVLFSEQALLDEYNALFAAATVAAQREAVALETAQRREKGFRESVGQGLRDISKR